MTNVSKPAIRATNLILGSEIVLCLSLINNSCGAVILPRVEVFIQFNAQKCINFLKKKT